MKYIILLIIITNFLGVTTSPNDNTYSATLTEITVKANILEGFKPQRAKTKEEIITLNRAIFQYVAKYSWMTPAQVYGKFRQEQGRGSQLFTKYNNVFNVKGNRASGTVTYKTKENRKDGTEYIIESKFAKYNTIQDALDDFIDLINSDRYIHIPSDNKTVFKHFYDSGYHTCLNWQVRMKYADEYEKQVV